MKDEPDHKALPNKIGKVENVSIPKIEFQKSLPKKHPSQPSIYRAYVRDGRVIVYTNPHHDDNFTEVVSLPAQAAEIIDAAEAHIEGEELIVRHRDGKAFAWNLRSQAPLGPR